MCLKTFKQFFKACELNSFTETVETDNSSNKEYLYLWLNNYQPLDDFEENLDINNSFLFEDEGFNLSSKYKITHRYYEKEHKIEFQITENDKNLSNLYDGISDIKAFVGKNGCGKTSIIRLLYKIIGKGFGNEGETNNEFILIYKQGNKIYYHQSEKSQKTLTAIKSNYKLKEEKNQFKSDLTIFYTGAVADRSISKNDSSTNCYDISTNGLMPIDHEALHSKPASINNSDYYSAYTIMEWTRKITFATHFYDIFNVPEYNSSKVYFRFPNGISIVPSNIDIDNSITEISESTEQKKAWIAIKNKQDNFEDRFCFAALLNHLKAFNSNRNMILKDCYNPDFYKYNNIKDIIKTYSSAKETIPIEEKKFAEQVFTALNTLKNIKENTSYNARIVNLKKNDQRQNLNKFIQVYKEIVLNTPFILMQWRPQSSGEENFIKIFARLFDVLSKDFAEHKQTPTEITLFIDEADLYLHPDWQCHWLWEFKEIYKEIIKDIYKTNNPKLQLLITTHSPFIITDLQEENIVLLKRDGDKVSTKVGKDIIINPFGSNIYELLKSGFFLEEHDFIGFFSKRKIEEAIDNINSKDLEKKEMSRFIINRIGDKIFKSLVQAMD